MIRGTYKLSGKVIEAGDSLQDKLTEMAFEGNVTAAI
jgi:hypothetical protein